MDMYKYTEEINQKIIERVKNNKPEERIPTDPNPRMLKKFYEKDVCWVNNEIDQVENEVNIKSSCKKGCNHCCKHPIAITTPEILAIKACITNMNSEIKKILLVKVNDVCNKIMENGIETNVTIFRADSSIDRYMEEYFKLNIPCPMLDENGLCSIYETRPANCWSYRGYGDPLDCKNSHSVDHSFKYSPFEAIILRRLLEAKKPKRNDIKLLPFAVRDILEGKI